MLIEISNCRESLNQKIRERKKERETGVNWRRKKKKKERKKGRREKKKKKKKESWSWWSVWRWPCMRWGRDRVAVAVSLWTSGCVTAWRGKDERAKSERETERETIPVPGGSAEEMRRLLLLRLTDPRQSTVYVRFFY